MSNLSKYDTNRTRLLVRIKCDHCDRTVDTTASLSADIESSGSIGLEADPDLPKDWGTGRWGRGYGCPEHREEDL